MPLFVQSSIIYRIKMPGASHCTSAKGGEDENQLEELAEEPCRHVLRLEGTMARSQLMVSVRQMRMNNHGSHLCDFQRWSA